MVDIAVNVIYSFSRGRESSTFWLAETICAIGNAVVFHNKQPRNSGNAAKIGGFILYSFEECGIISTELLSGKKRHAAYGLLVKDHESLEKMWQALPAEKTNKMPLFAPYPSWSCAVNHRGEKLIKTPNKYVLGITAETHPLVFEVVNRSQKIGWIVNKAILDTASWAFREKQDAFAEIWQLHDREARASKVRETKTVINMANKVKKDVFYHRYYLDFRGRKYPATAYLHEQGSDLAGALLLRAEGKPLGSTGYFWLCVCIASNWGGDSGHPSGQKTDKLPLMDRVAWVQRHEGLLLSYAASPREHTDWMKADKPWKFLADCIELLRLKEWQNRNRPLINTGELDRYGYVCAREGFIDGSNNGCQHLAALTKDEMTAPHVNLIPMELPGDLYKYVGEHVWKFIDIELTDYNDDTKVACNTVLDNLIKLQTRVHATEPKTDERAEVIEELRAFREKHADELAILAPVFWARITDSKQRRKIVKRGVMTIPYGGTKYGLGEQCIDDARKHGIDLLNNMEHRWGAYMGRVIYEDCKTSLLRPMKLLSVFEEAGKKAEIEERFLKWHAPITNFPVVQHYTEGVVKKVWVQYGPPIGERTSTGRYANTLQVNVCFKEHQVRSKGKQSTGASPNIIHSLDAAHLMLTVHMCDFEVTTIHDSYGTLFCDMDKLYVNVRRAFVKLYQHDPLSSILKEIDGDISKIDLGTLNIMCILDSEYCFA